MIYKIRKKFNPDIDEFCKLYEDLKGSRKIAKIYGTDKTTILNFAKTIGFDTSKFTSKRNLSDNQVLEIINGYNYYTTNELASKYNCSKSLISKIWMENNLSGKGFSRRYYSDFHYFEELDSDDKAYFIGFIGADGCVYDRNNGTQQKMLSIGIHKQDEIILNKLLKYMKSNNPINHYKNTVQVQIVNDILCNSLLKYNITPRKTECFVPKNIPNNKIWHFLRGYFDGDGCISWNKNKILSKCNISYCGNLYIIQYISNILKENQIQHSIYQDKRKYNFDFYSLYITNKKSRIKFIEKLYENCSDLYLPRKKQLSEDYYNAYLKNEKEKKIMSKIRGFQRISYNQYCKDIGGDINLDQEYRKIKLPQRATEKSSGYDFFSVCDFQLNPGEEIKLPTGIKIYMKDNEELLIFPRSSVGFKYNIKINNTIGKIDADYYNNPDNEGHVWIKFTNTGNKVWEVKQGEAIAQGSFYKYLKADNDVPRNKERIGGLGSTN